MDLWLLFLSELLGTFVLILIGLSVTINVLSKEKQSNSDNLIIAFGWGIGIIAGALIASYSGSAINPAVSLTKLLLEFWTVDEFFVAISAQFLGAFVAALLIYMLYYNYLQKEEDPRKIESAFVAGASKHTWEKKEWRRYTCTFLVEILASTIFLLVIFLPDTSPSPVIIGMVAAGLIISFGSITGPSLNPARDIMPRLVHQVMPIKNKGSSDWLYSISLFISPFIASLITWGLVLVF